MDPFLDARRQAHAIRAEVADPERLAAPTLIRQVAALWKIECLSLEPDDPLLFGARAMLDRAAMAVFLAQQDDEAEAAALIAHELGHLILHEGTTLCDQDDLEADADAEKVASVGTTGVGAYHARERQESEANIFARELLLPADLARRFFLAGQGAEEISSRLSLPLEIVRRQLCEALLLSPIGRTETPPEASAARPLDSEESDLQESAPPIRSIRLDASQQTAAEHLGSPLLLSAGPGTGKTRTLIGRILFLLERGVDAASILALTFSNKAAAEMSGRLAEAAPEQASAVWTGTFHAFGLELLRRHHDVLGLEPDFRVADRADAIAILEDHLQTLGLVHYAAQYEPALELQDLLSAISRAKDERVDARGYQALAAAMRQQASDPDQRLAAERAAEVGRVYALYEKRLGESQRVDFGDLIARAARLLEDHPHIRASLRLRHRHVLVDEYQDTNRASRELLKLLVGRGERLWVVGDARQSIYRFRGASESNIRCFAQDFPGASRQQLEVCYRSTSSILESFETFGAQLDIDAAESSHQHRKTRPARGAGSRPRLIEAADPAAEIAAVAAEIQRLDEVGVPFRQQAILCRTHGQLEAMASGLERHGLAILHLGPFFEREEVRDLLSILSLVVDPAGGSLMRLAALAEYAIPIQDVHTFLQWLRVNGLSADDGLARLAENRQQENPLLSEPGLEGLNRLAEHLARLEKRSSAWQILATYLFECAEWPREVLCGGDRLKAMAIYQCLAFVRAGVPGGRGWPARRLLDRVRRLALLGEERNLRQIPGAALDIDAVRLLTLHGAKGLEFDAVHIPGLARGQLPHRYRPPRCPQPPGLVRDGEPGQDPDRKAHAGDEQCLTFVALSRARDHLLLYRHQRAGGRNRRASPFLDRLGDSLKVTPPAGEVLAPAPSLPLPIEDSKPLRLEISDIRLYESCPRRFFYSRLFELPGSRRHGPLADISRAFYQTLDRWRLAPTDDLEAIRGHFQAALKESGTATRAQESNQAAVFERQLRHLAEAAKDASPSAPWLRLELDGASFEARPLLIANGSKLLFVRAGSSRRFSSDDVSLGLIQEAVRQEFGTGGVQVEILYLGDGERLPLLLPQKKASEHVARAETAAREIGKRQFPASPEARRCARCPYFFVCPALPEGELRLSHETED